MKFSVTGLAIVCRNTTVRVVAALLLCLAVLLFFQHVPRALQWPVRMFFLAVVVWLIFVAVQTVRTWPFTWKNLLFSLVMTSLLYGAVNLVCRVFIRLMSTRDDRLSTRVVKSLAERQRQGIEAMLDGTSYEMYDRDIGWVPRPGYQDGSTRISSQGLRSLRGYEIPPPVPEKRILCLGDSFTYGHSVSDTETYPYHGEQLRKGTEWINLGISGACLTQFLMQYRKNGRRFGGKYVVIGFMTDDAKRTVNCFRPFLTGWNPFTKPFAKFSNGTFSIEPNPYQDLSDYRRLLTHEREEIERLLMMDYLTWSNQVPTNNPVLRTAEYVYESMHLDRNLYGLLHRKIPKPPSKPRQVVDPSTRVDDPYGRIFWDAANNRWSRKTGGTDPYGRAIWSPDSPGFIALTHVMDLLHKEIIADGRVPLIVIIPGPLDVENHARKYPRLYQSFVNHLEAQGFHYIDFLDRLVAQHKDDLSLENIFVQSHFRGSVNKELATSIIEALRLP